MNTKRFYQLLTSHLKVSTRNKSALFFTIIFPLIFIGVFGIAFQESDPANTTLPIAVINNDNGIPNNAYVLGLNNQQMADMDISNQFLDILESITFEDRTTQILELQMYDSIEEAETKVKRQSVKGLLVIPEDFSLGFLASIRTNVDNETINWQGYPSADYQTVVELIGDPSLIQYNIVVSVMREVVKQFFSLSDGTINGILAQSSSIESEGFTSFDFVVPGLVIFAIIANANTVAAVAVHDVESNILNRLKLTKIKKWEYPTSLVLSQIIVSFVQIPLLFGTALVFGFPLVPQLGLAFIFATFVSMAMSGIGMLLAGFAKDANSVGGMASIVTTPMAFFAGAFFAMPNPEILPAGVLGEVPFGLFDILPPTRAISSLRLVIFNGYGLGDIAFDLLITVGLAIFYLAIGIYVYTRKHMGTN